VVTRRPNRRNGRRVLPDEQLRLMTKVARLYHEHDVRQPEIARRLHVSQARVSRLLKQAEQEGIVRTSVVVPEGVLTAVEDELEAAYGLREAVVVDCLDATDDGVTYDLGVATGAYLELTLTGGDIVGISSWSSTLLAAVDSMRPLSRRAADRVVQLMGGIGDPAAETHAAHLTQRFSELTGARPTFLVAPGIASSSEVRKVLLQERYVQEAMAAMDELTLALVGIGSLEPSPLLQRSGNIFSDEEREQLGAQGAVGDICLRLFDIDGRPIESQVNERVIAVSLEQLARVDRLIGVAGGPRKHEAIRAALRGRLVNVLITDRVTAERLLADRPASDVAGADAAAASR
jgi:DNA-binding transcriptional regulator LsrR (DeoR family)